MSQINLPVDHSDTPGSSRSTWQFIVSELRPKGAILTPFNLITLPIMILGLYLIIIRFIGGLGTITNLNQTFPWGLWIGFDVVTGVAFAGGAYTLVFMVYILNLKKYYPIARATVLTGFLAYVFYSGALLLDLGRPWNVINPIIGNNYGVSSVLFLVAWHFLLYMLALFIEFSPAIAEWLNMPGLRRFLSRLTLGAVIFGITLSTLHQAGLGALFLMASEKIHPLWYNSLIPVTFVVTSIFGGLSMVIFEGSISHRVFSDQLEPGSHQRHNDILHGLSRVCAGAMFVYLALHILIFIHQGNHVFLNSRHGLIYLVEMVGLTALPMVLYLAAYRKRNIQLVKTAAILTVLGIVLNRLNVSIIGFKWDVPNHYIPSWQEIIVTLAVISAEIWVFRWIVLRMPVLRKGPAWARDQH